MGLYTGVLCQFWHVWNCRTRVDSIFVRGIFSNVATVRQCRLPLSNPR